MIYGQAITLGKSVSGEIAITENGIYDVEDYASANVNVQSAPVLLWTNASPTSEFAAQTLTVPTGYSGYLVEVRNGSTASGVLIKTYVPVGGSTVCCSTQSYTIDRIPTRRVVTANDGSLVFTTGGGSASGKGGNYAIPTRIWGVKFTL